MEESKITTEETKEGKYINKSKRALIWAVVILVIIFFIGNQKTESTSKQIEAEKAQQPQYQYKTRTFWAEQKDYIFSVEIEDFSGDIFEAGRFFFVPYVDDVHKIQALFDVYISDEYDSENQTLINEKLIGTFGGITEDALGPFLIKPGYYVKIDYIPVLGDQDGNSAIVDVVPVDINETKSTEILSDAEEAPDLESAPTPSPTASPTPTPEPTPTAMPVPSAVDLYFPSAPPIIFHTTGQENGMGDSLFQSKGVVSRFVHAGGYNGFVLTTEHGDVQIFDIGYRKEVFDNVSTINEINVYYQYSGWSDVTNSAVGFLVEVSSDETPIHDLTDNQKLAVALFVDEAIEIDDEIIDDYMKRAKEYK